MALQTGSPHVLRTCASLLPSLAALALLGACGAEHGGNAPPPAPQPPQPTGAATQSDIPIPPVQPPGTGIQVDWDNLNNPDLIEVPSLEAAARTLPFTPIRPRQLGTPSKILVLDPGVAPRKVRGVALRYDHATYGRFWVTQDLPPKGIPPDRLQAELESSPEGCDPARGCEAKLTVETIRGGIRALLQVGPPTHGATSLTWYEEGLALEVLGPPDVFTGEEALAVANDL